MAGIIVLLVLMALFLKKEHYVKREIIINAPPKKVFDQIKLFWTRTSHNFTQSRRLSGFGLTDHGIPLHCQALTDNKLISPMAFPTLLTPRLLLRQLEETDEAAIFSLRSDDRVNRFLDRPKQNSMEEASAFIKKINDAITDNKSFYWAISVKHEPGLIGTICLWNISPDRKTVELGYELHPDQQGKGYMNEAIKAVIGHAFKNAGFSNLEAYTHKDNEASTKLLLKNHFVRQTDCSDPENSNLIIFLLKK